MEKRLTPLPKQTKCSDGRKAVKMLVVNIKLIDVSKKFLPALNFRGD